MFACVQVCICTIFVPDDFKIQKRALDPLELELRIVVGHHVVLGTDSSSFARVAN